jgi:CRP-like cAMP-binding protein
VSESGLKGFALFGDLGDAEREELAALLEERDLSSGETLFEEGDEADALVLVLRGGVELASRRSDAKVVVGPGDTIGALALFAVGSRETTAVGAEPSDLRLLRREDFLRFAEDHPRPAFRIAAAVAGEVAQHARAALAGDASVG